MIDWIQANEAVLNVSVGLATLLVWVIYAQLLYSGFRRQRTPRMLINRGRKRDLDALCIISNMSQEAIYVEYIIATLETSTGTITMDVTDFEREPAENREGEEGDPQTVPVTPANVRENTRQGPLLSGEFMHIGTFSDLVRRLARQAKIPMQGHRPQGDLKLESLTIELIALYGPEPKPVSASRKFCIDSSKSGGALMPTSWQTRQGNSFLERRRLSRLVDRMNETNFVMSSTVRRDQR